MIIDILPAHSKVLSIDRNITIKIGLAAMWEQRTSHCVVWDSLRNAYNGTLILRDFLDVLFHPNPNNFASGENKDHDDILPSDSKDDENNHEFSDLENYMKIIEEMEHSILK